MSDRFCSRCGALVPASHDECGTCGFAEPHRHAVDDLPVGSVGSRLLAAGVDLGPLVLLSAGAVALLFVTVDQWVRLAVLGGVVGWLLVQCGLAMAGGTPGKRWQKLVVVAERTGAKPGPAAVIARELVRAVSSVITVGVAGFSYRWDASGKERTWWDLAAGTKVLSAVGSAAGSAASSSPMVGAARWPGAPQPGGGGSPAGPPSQSPLGTSPLSPLPLNPSPLGTSPLGPANSAGLASWAGPVDHRPSDAEVTTVIRLPEQSIDVISGSDLSWDPSPTEVIPVVHLRSDDDDEPASDTESLTDHLAPVDVPTVPSLVDARCGLPIDQHATDDHPAPDSQPAPDDQLVPDDQPAEPQVVEFRAGPPVWRAPFDQQEAATVTRVVNRRELLAQRPVSATLEWDSGSRFVAGGQVLIGREPMPLSGEHVDRRLAVGADSMGVSKTHVLLSITTTGVTVVDRFSTNGVIIERVSGEEYTCQPGRVVPLAEGDRVHFGGRWVRVVPPGEI